MRSTFFALIVLPSALVLSGGSCSHKDSSAPPPGATTNQGKISPTNPGQGTPAETFITYIEALRLNDYKRAIQCLYMPTTNQLEIVQQGFAPLAEKIRAENWVLRIETTGEQGRFAAIVYSTNAEGNDFEPVLALRDTDNKWRLHHRDISGGLRNLFTGKEYDTAIQVIKWGREKVRDAKIKASRREPVKS